MYVGRLWKWIFYCFFQTGLRKFQRLFEVYGTVKTIRIRSIPSNGKTNLAKKMTYVHKELDREHDTVHAYVVYESKEKDSITTAIEQLNGVLFEGKHLRVDRAFIDEKTFDRKRSIFLGNLPFDLEDESLWQHFEGCGSIESVRIIRDSKTQHGKGIGYIQFKDTISIGLALKLNGTQLNNRTIRVKECLDSQKTKQVGHSTTTTMMVDPSKRSHKRNYSKIDDLLFEGTHADRKPIIGKIRFMKRKKKN